MSIKLITRALEQPLRPIDKLVLTVLADLANDNGICWPRLSFVAPLASVSVRTLQRALVLLEGQGLIQRQPRYRADGSQSSSQYIIFPKPTGGDYLSPHTALSVSPPLPTMPAGRGADDTPIPTKEPKEINRHNHMPARLVYPKSFDANRVMAADRLLSKLSPTDAQALIDELVGRMNQGCVKSPLSYLRALTKRHADGQFVPELADQVSRRRQKLEEQAPVHKASTRLPREQVEQHLITMRRSIMRGANHDE